MHQKNQKQTPKHFPVLLNEVLHYLCPKEGESYLDLTAGYGGHASNVLERTLQPKRATLVDRDQNATEHLKQTFEEKNAQIIHSDYLSASTQLLSQNKEFDCILADLGVSSPQLDTTDRGFSLQNEAELDMRMDIRQELTAKTIVNSYSEAELTDLLTRYGEEPKARQIARRIVANRPLHTTQELAGIAAQAWPGYSRLHPATRTFQALRIAVNDELRQLAQSLPIWVSLLAPGGRLVIITFHSLEDRVVKQFFAEQSEGYESTLRILTSKPVLASSDEIAHNPRARSAKLRAAVKK